MAGKESVKMKKIAHSEALHRSFREKIGAVAVQPEVSQAQFD